MPVGLTAGLATTGAKLAATQAAQDKAEKEGRRDAALSVATQGVSAWVGAAESGRSKRADIKEQNRDGYKYGGSVSQTGGRRSRTRAPEQNGTAKRAWLFGGLALLTWLAVRR